MTLGTYTGRTSQPAPYQSGRLTADQLTQRSLKAIDLYVEGNPLEDIAEALGCPLGTVQSIIDNPLAQARITQIQLAAESTNRRAALALARLTPQAAQVMAEALEGNLRVHKRDREGNLVYDDISGSPVYQTIAPEARIGVAKDILDRSESTAKVSKSQITHDTTLLDDETVMRVKERYRAAMERNSTPVTFTEIPPDTLEDDPIPEDQIGDGPWDTSQGQEPALSAEGVNLKEIS